MIVFGSDIDGCLANIEPELERRIIEKFDLDEGSANKVEFYMHERFQVPQDAMKAFLYDEVFVDPTFWLAAEPFEFNIQVMTSWVLEHGAVPSLITARDTHTRTATELWAARNNVPYSNLLFGTENNKHLAVKWTDCQFMIEDKYEEALSIHLQSDARSYIYRTPYNEKFIPQFEYGVRQGIINPDKLCWIDDYAEITEREFNGTNE